MFSSLFTNYYFWDIPHSLILFWFSGNSTSQFPFLKTGWLFSHGLNPFLPEWLSNLPGLCVVFFSAGKKIHHQDRVLLWYSSILFTKEVQSFISLNRNKQRQNQITGNKFFFFQTSFTQCFAPTLSSSFSSTRITMLVCRLCQWFLYSFYMFLHLILINHLAFINASLSALSISVSGKTHGSICFVFHLFLMITSVISVIKLLKRLCLFLAFILNERWWFCPAASVRFHSALSHSTIKIQHLFEHNSKERGCRTFLICNKFSQQEFHVVNNSGGIKFYYFPYVLGYNSMKYLTWSTCLNF